MAGLALALALALAVSDMTLSSASASADVFPAGTVVVLGAVPAVSGMMPASPVSATASGSSSTVGCLAALSVSTGPATASLTLDAAFLALAVAPLCFLAGGLVTLLLLVGVVATARPLLAAGGGAGGSFLGGRLRNSTILVIEFQDDYAITVATGCSGDASGTTTRHLSVSECLATGWGRLRLSYA